MHVSTRYYGTPVGDFDLALTFARDGNNNYGYAVIDSYIHEGGSLLFIDFEIEILTLEQSFSDMPRSLNPRYNPCSYTIVWDTDRGTSIWLSHPQGGDRLD